MARATAIAALWTLVAAGAASAQRRTLDDALTDRDLLLDILAAEAERIDAADDVARNARFDGRSFADFDRDLDAQFQHPAAARGPVRPRPGHHAVRPRPR